MVEDQRVTVPLPTVKQPESRLLDAAGWLASHRDQCTSRVIPTLKQRFGLSTCEAITAAQMAHALQYGGV